MKKYIAIIILLIAVTAYAFPPTPPTVNITGNAATATALASNPTDCGSNAVATAIDASGNLTCSQSIGTIATQNASNVTITGGNVTGLTTFSAATTNIDHIGEKTSAHGVVVDNNITVSGAVTADTMSASVVKTVTAADATLSGTPIIITIYDAASNTPYYFKAYPTKQ